MATENTQINWFELGDRPINGYIEGWLWYYIDKRSHHIYAIDQDEYVAVYYDRNNNTDTIIKTRCGLDEAKAACEQHNQARQANG